MMKQTMKQWMAAAAMVLGLLTMTSVVTSCSNRDMEVYPVDDVVTQDPEAEPTEDLLTTKVTNEIEAAVIGTPAEGSVGAALVKRVSEVTDDISLTTDLVLFNGSEFSESSVPDEDVMRAAALVYISGGYVGILQPTEDQTTWFYVSFLSALADVEADVYEDMFDIDEATAAAAARHSMSVDRLQTRLENMKAMATRAGATADSDLFAEMIILASTDYFMQEPLTDENTSYYTYFEESDGNVTKPEAVTSDQGYTPYEVGLMADAAAQWLNDVEKTYEEGDVDDNIFNAPAMKAALTRSDAQKAINDLMEACEKFTFSGRIQGGPRRMNCFNSTIRSWGVHNMTTNCDYYYVKENVTLSMQNIYNHLEPNEWYETHDEKYDCRYGSFLSQYVTSMNLGSHSDIVIVPGTVRLEAAKPETDNYTSTTTVTIGSSSSTTETYGWTWNLTGGMTGGKLTGTASVGGSYSVGTTESNSFSMGTAKPQKDLGVAKNTDGTRVEWTYKGNLPKFQVKHENGKYYRMHEIAADILTNDANLTNEACWSVQNPEGQYEFVMTVTPQTAALVYNSNDKNVSSPAHAYQYTAMRPQEFVHQLLQPNRAVKTWRAYLTIDEWTNGFQAGAKDKIEAKLKEKFPDTYHERYEITAKDANDLSLASAYFKNQKNVLGAQIDMLLEIGREYGVKKYSINWRCDDRNVALREAFTVDAGAYYPSPTDMPQVIWCEKDSTLYFIHTAQLKKGDQWNGKTVTDLWSGNDVVNITPYMAGVPLWTNEDLREKARHIVIDKTFSAARPKVLYGYFALLEGVRDIVGLEYLNTSEATNMQCMFSYLRSIQTLDLYNFDMSKVTNAMAMFSKCTKLTTIYCNQTWPSDKKFGRDMFDMCRKLKGAASWSNQNRHSDMANPTTGYFSVKPDPEPDYSNLPTIYLKDAQANATLIQQNQGQQVNIIYSRTLTTDKTADGKEVATPWTVCLPYDLDLTARSQSGQISLYTLAAVENGQFVFVKLDGGYLTAGQPYVVMVNSGRVPLRAQGVTIKATKPASLKVYNSVAAWRAKVGTVVGQWTGTFDLLDADYAAGVGAFALQTTDKSWNFFNSKGTATIPAFRAYLTSTNIDEQVYKARYE